MRLRASRSPMGPRCTRSSTTTRPTPAATTTAWRISSSTCWGSRQTWCGELTAVDARTFVAPAGESGARSDGARGEAYRIAVEVDSVRVDERHRLLEEERGEIVQVGDRFGDVEAMVGHVRAAAHDTAVSQHDLKLAPA